MQACACADAGAALISPFVGRILDWHKKKHGRDFAPEEVRPGLGRLGGRWTAAGAGRVGVCAAAAGQAAVRGGLGGPGQWACTLLCPRQAQSPIDASHLSTAPPQDPGVASVKRIYK